MSVASANGTSPRATAKAEPELEPPASRSGRAGCGQSPKCGFSPVSPKANSLSCVRPHSIAPASSAKAAGNDDVARAGPISSARKVEPAQVGSPARK